LKEPPLLEHVQTVYLEKVQVQDFEKYVKYSKDLKYLVTRC